MQNGENKKGDQQTPSALLRESAIVEIVASIRNQTDRSSIEKPPQRKIKKYLTICSRFSSFAKAPAFALL